MARISSNVRDPIESLFIYFGEIERSVSTKYMRFSMTFLEIFGENDSYNRYAEK